MFSLGIVGAGRFAGPFAQLWRLHQASGHHRHRPATEGPRAWSPRKLPGTVPPSRPCSTRGRRGGDLHAALDTRHVVAAYAPAARLLGGSMAVTEQEVAAIIDAVRDTGLTS